MRPRRPISWIGPLCILAFLTLSWQIIATRLLSDFDDIIWESGMHSIVQGPFGEPIVLEHGHFGPHKEVLHQAHFEEELEYLWSVRFEWATRIEIEPPTTDAELMQRIVHFLRPEGGNWSHRQMGDHTLIEHRYVEWRPLNVHARFHRYILPFLVGANILLLYLWIKFRIVDQL
jgi:hypothetical protein